MWTSRLGTDKRAIAHRSSAAISVICKERVICHGVASRHLPGKSPMETFEQLFEETLKDIYYAEKAILKALPKMAKKATSKKLQTAFTKHESETEKQVDRLDQVFELLGTRAAGK
jgi:hypothetical protein